MNRSLPLSLSGALLGIALAAADYRVDWKTALFLILAVVFLHFYSVSVKSEDDSCRKWSVAFLTMVIICGLTSLYFSFGTLFLMEPLLLVVFGYMIIRAVKHTDFVSRGKGIIYVFTLLGLIAFYLSYYVCSHSLGGWLQLLPALSVGFLSVAARTASDRTVFITVMTVLGWAAMMSYAGLRMFDLWHFLFVLSLPFFFLKRPGLATFVFAVLAGAGFLVFLVGTCH